MGQGAAEDVSDAGDGTDSTSLTIAETSARTGVSAHALRYYERIDLIDPVSRTPGGQRQYGEGDVTRIVFLSRMRATGMPIESLRRYVGLIREGQHTSAQRRASLEAHRAELAANRQVLNEALAILDRKINDYRIWERKQ